MLNNFTLPLVALLFTSIIFGLLFYLKKKNVNFGIRTIVATLLGVLIGIIFREHVIYVEVFGKIYISVIYSIVVPLLVVSVINSVSSLKNISTLKSIGLKSISWLTLNTLLASTLTLGLAFVFNIGSNQQITLPSDYVAKEVPGFTQVVLDFFPKNIVADASSGKILPIILFSLAVGIAIISISSKDELAVKPFKDFMQSFSKIIFWLIEKIIGFTPYAVFSLIASATSKNTPEKLAPLLVVLLVAYAACLIHTFLINGLMIQLFAKISPLSFFKKIWPAQFVAFTSQSSVSTLPVTIEVLRDKVGVHENIASFVSSLGTTVGMPGCAGIWPTLLAVFAIKALNIPFSNAQYVILILTTVLVSLGTAGVPGTATITATAVFVALGLPIEVIVLMTPISSIVDMARTATNVTAAAVTATIVANSQGELGIDHKVGTSVGF